MNPLMNAASLDASLDYRSDTCTIPLQSMLDVIGHSNTPQLTSYTCGLGDAVYGDDPTVHELEKQAALICGKEAALFCVTGCMANLVAIMSHCDRGQSMITGQKCHVYKYEAGSSAVLGSVVCHQTKHQPDGSLIYSDVVEGILPLDFHHPIAKLISVENPISGKVWSLDKMRELRELADANGLNIHLDGARMFNGCAALGVDPQVFCRDADSVMFCLSKGLCAPVGSMLCGRKEFIDCARRHWKMLGGGWRQAGVLASAGLYALDNMVERLHADHEQAKYFAQQLSISIERFAVAAHINLEFVQTNMVLIELQGSQWNGLQEFMKSRGVKLSVSADMCRVVFHEGNCSNEHTDYLLECFNNYFSKEIDTESN
eukprot:GHVH01000092.1.p1 GENE.GHVH01000092.1~~GHVH01000092.1.p1  ORF type:complete len:389 (+),score=51.83 GHVH01000092.1:51-1169(+)